MKEDPGYPLPDGALGEDDIVCQLVYLPDRPEYWQAFLGSLHYMTTWRAWERDPDKRGKDAASNWRDAFELTIGCWRMTCLQDLQDNVAEILAIMQLGSQCCDSQDITDGDRYTDRVTDGEGNVPQNVIDAGYADDAADWAGFDDYKCMVVNVTVNQMEARLREIADVVDSAGPYLGVAAALAAILGVIFATAGLAIVFGIVAGIGAVSALYFGLIEFGPVDDLADDVATNHDELACAMYDSDGDVGALVALNDKIDELFSVAEAVILKNLNNGPTLKALYAGRYDQQDIAAELEAAGYDVGDFDCTCDAFPTGEYNPTFTFPVDKEGFEYGTWNNGTIYHEYHSLTQASCNTIRSKVGLSTSHVDDTITIYKVRYEVYRSHAGLAKHRFRITANSGGNYSLEQDTPDDVWTQFEHELDPPRVVFGNWNGIHFDAPNGTGGQQSIRNVYIDFDAPDPV